MEIIPSYSTILIVFCLVFSFTGCKKEKEHTKADEIEFRKEMVADALNSDSEKILLLSNIEKISYDSLKSVLYDYNFMTDEHQYDSDSLKIDSQNAINKISKKYLISKSRTASLIFSFKYEMISKDEIVEREKVYSSEGE